MTTADPSRLLAGSDPLGLELDMTSSLRARAAVLAAEGDGRGAAHELLAAGRLLLDEGDATGALADFVQAGALLRDAGAIAELVEALELCARTTATFLLGDPEALWHELLVLHQAIGDLDAQARVCYELYLAAGSSETGRQRLAEGAALGDDLGWALRCRGMLALLASRYHEVLEVDTRALRMARERGDRRLETLALEALTHAHSYVGEPASVVRALRQIVVAASATGDHETAVKSQGNLVELLLENLELAEAATAADALDGYVRRHRLDRYVPFVASRRTRVAHMAGDIGEAVSVGREGCALVGSGQLLVDTVVMFITADALLVAGEHDEAARLLDAATSMLERHPFESFVFEVRMLRGRLLASSGDVPAGLGLTARPWLDEPPSRALHARELMRLGAWCGAADAVARARDLVDGIDTSGPLVQACVAEIDAIAAALDATGEAREQALARLDACATRWTDAGCIRDAACARATAALLRIGRGRNLDSDQVERVRELHERLVALGAHHDARRVADALQRATGAGEDGDGADVASGLLAGLDERQRRAVTSCTARVGFKRGKQFFTPADTSSTVYVLRRGRVRLYRTSADGKQLAVAVLDPGAVFGEGALLDLGAGLGAEAIEDGEVAVIAASQLRALMDRIPRLGFNLLEEVGRRLDRSEQLAELIAYASVKERFARIVLDLDARYGHPTLDGNHIVNQSFTQGELAEMVGATRKAVALLIGELRRDGVIDLRGKRIVVLSRSVLEQLARRTGTATD